MKWITNDRYGKPQTWYSEDVIEKIKAKCEYQLKKINSHPFVLGAKDFSRDILAILNEVDK